MFTTARLLASELLAGTALVCLLAIGLPAPAQAGSYTEDFTSTDYGDMGATTACWNTDAGELSLWPNDMAVIGGVDTPGTARHLFVAGNHAFLADGEEGLQVVDISDPANPAIIGTVDTPGLAYGVTVAGNVAYVADADSGLQVIDISTPSSPVIVGSMITPGKSWHAAIEGDVAYVADHTGGLLAVDISDPANPALIGSVATADRALRVAVAGNVAYVADYVGDLQVVDITDPTNLAIIASVDLPDIVRDVTVAGDVAYVAGHWSGVEALDISDPTNPILIGSLVTPNRAMGVTTSGDMIYVADYESGLLAIDITDPADLQLMGCADTEDLAWGVVVAGDVAYVADRANGLVVVEVGETVSPSLIGNVGFAYAIDVAAVGDVAFVVDLNGALMAVDISDPTNPVEIGAVSLTSNASQVAVSGDVAYVVSGYYGLSIVDVSDPVNLTVIGTLGLSDPHGVAVSGDIACVLDSGANALWVVNVSDPAFPAITGIVSVGATTYGVAMSGNLVFVAGYNDGLEVVDISDPTSPAVIGTCPVPGNAYDVKVSGDVAYLTCVAGGLQVVDVSDPTNPILLGGVILPDCLTKCLTVAGDLAYVTDVNDDTLWIVDISDPSEPVIIDIVGMPDRSLDLCVAGEVAYVACKTSVQACRVRSLHTQNWQDNQGQSLTIPGLLSNIVLGVRVTPAQVGENNWWLSDDGGGSWVSVPAAGEWFTLGADVSDLRWRSEHIWDSSDPLVIPTCTGLEIKWLNEFPFASAITDIPNDQGRQVRLSWDASGYDQLGSTTPITEYAIYRRIDEDLRRGGDPGEDSDAANDPGSGLLRVCWPPGDWDYLASVPACCEGEYAMVVPTLADSTIADGMYFTTYFVRALTDVPGVYFDSPPDSGYSVDNLAPTAPANFRIEPGAMLAWDETAVEDFNYFTLYGSESETLDESAEVLLHTTDTSFDFSEDVHPYFHLTVTDFSGNEGEEATADASSSVSDPTLGRSTLHPNTPNPFGAHTQIQFAIADPGWVRLRVFTPEGRRVATLIDGPTAAGSHAVTWLGIDELGRPVPSGTYFYRLETGAFQQTRQAIVMR